MNVAHLFLVGAGGCLGSMARYAVVVSVDRRISSLLPYGTLIVNVAGAFIVGMLFGLIGSRTSGESWRLFLGTGFCGGFTTFSALAFENFHLIGHRQPAVAVVYVGVSLVGGLLAVAAGHALGRSLG